MPSDDNCETNDMGKIKMTLKCPHLEDSHQWANWKRMYENNSIYNNLKKNQIPRCKPNKRCEW
jgi:hypothetical protein